MIKLQRSLIITTFLLFVGIGLFSSCNSTDGPSTITENGNEEAVEEENEGNDVESLASYPVQTRLYSVADAKKEIERIITDYNDNESEFNYHYTWLEQETGGLARVYTLDGNLEVAEWANFDMCMNGYVQTFVNNDGQLTLVMENCHGSTWFNETYYFCNPDSVLVFGKMGEITYPDESGIGQGYDDAVLEYEGTRDIEDFEPYYQKAYVLAGDALTSTDMYNGSVYYAGNISTYPFKAHLYFYNPYFATGKGRYENGSKPLRLQAEIDGQNIVITEYDGDTETGIFTGLLTDEGGITGNWSTPDGSTEHSFKLDRTNSYD